MGKEFATRVGASLYAGSPQLEALTILIAAAALDDTLRVMLSDVKRAYFHAAAKRELYVEIPEEDPDWSPDAMGRLNLALYGTRDAAKLWQEIVSKHLISIRVHAWEVQPMRLLSQAAQSQGVSARRRLCHSRVLARAQVAPGPA